MFGRLFLMFTLIPALELVLLVKIGSQIGTDRTIALILITGILGAWMARREGTRVWGQVNKQLQQGTVPGQELVEALLILLSGAMLITPGFMTDILGFSLLVPQIRIQAAKALRDRFSKHVNFQSFTPPGGPFPPGPGDMG